MSHDDVVVFGGCLMTVLAPGRQERRHMLGGTGRRVETMGDRSKCPASDSEKIQRLGEFGARGIGWEPLEHGA